MTDNRLAGADFVRAMACLFVLLHHLIQRLSPGVVRHDFKGLYDFGHFGSFGVGIFFVLSGFLLARPFWAAYEANAAMPSLRTYAMRRAARILPGYWLALTVSFVLSLTVFGFPFDQLTLVRYLVGWVLVGDFHYATLFPVEFNGPLWSIAFETTSYVLLPLCLALVFLARPVVGPAWGGRALWLVVIAAAVGAHYLVQAYWPMDNHMRGWNYGTVGGAKEWMPRFNPVGFFTIFAIGALAAGVQVRWAASRHWLFDVLVVAGLALTAWTQWDFIEKGPPEGWGLFNIPYGYPVYPLAVALVLAAAPSSRLAGRILDNPASRYIASISFGIYIWHYPIMELIRQVWFDRYYYHGMTNVAAWVLPSSIVVVASFLVAHVSWRVLEQPVIRWARGLETRKPAPSSEPAPAAT